MTMVGHTYNNVFEGLKDGIIASSGAFIGYWIKLVHEGEEK